MKKYKHYLFDWGNTLMIDLSSEDGPMYNWSKVEVVEGAYELLCELNKTSDCHIATNAKDSSECDIRKALARVRLDKYIKNIFCFRSIGYEKPSKKFFENILTPLKCKKSEVVMVGDNLEKDVIGALNFGLNAIWLNIGKQQIPENIISIDNLLQIINS